ncbi:MAG: signal recognition particle protein [Deltaproteobacteria bacterium]|nr:signal recognition particle protein [Deltaproteobacteria bacterium]
MLETLSKGFRAAKRKLSGVAEIHEDDIDEALREVRMSLLEADVDFKVTKNFLNRVREKAVGEVVRLSAKAKNRKVKVTPAEHFISICKQELEHLMGPVDTSLNYERHVSAIMMVGLQGSGKTTTAAKLARFIRDFQARKPILVAADVYRPAAIDQLKVLGERLGVPVYYEDSGDPIGICSRALETAKDKGCDTAIFDTAGRLAIDDTLMNELEKIQEKTSPENILLVSDAMIGQDAVRTASEFNRRLELTGFILTKLDGDARGGAALSIKEVTGRPIKFIGMGEGLDQLEEFRPDGLASRILGLGDIVGLMQDFESVVDAEKAERDAMRMLRGRFTMDDFLEQIRTLKKMGSLSDLFEKLPMFPDGLPEGMAVDDTQLLKIESIIQSMTKKERLKPEIIDPSRVVRIATGSGRKVQDVEELQQRFLAMKEMMSAIGTQPGLLSKIPGFKQLGQIGQLRKMLKQKGGRQPMPLGMEDDGNFPAGPRPKTDEERKKAKKFRKKLKEQRRKSKKKKKKKKK